MLCATVPESAKSSYLPASAATVPDGVDKLAPHNNKGDAAVETRTLDEERREFASRPLIATPIPE